MNFFQYRDHLFALQHIYSFIATLYILSCLNATPMPQAQTKNQCDLNSENAGLGNSQFAVSIITLVQHLPITYNSEPHAVIINRRAHASHTCDLHFHAKEDHEVKLSHMRASKGVEIIVSKCRTSRCELR